MRLLVTKRFERDLRRCRRRGKDLERLWAVVDRLLAEKPLEPRHRAHRLSGEWARSWECRVEPDWLLVWHVDDDALVLTRTGTHSDLFG